ncbi:hypothetical protein F8C13_27385 [Escherichia coli]|nr:hypothetical protein [Escherichia coli]
MVASSVTLNSDFIHISRIGASHPRVNYYQKGTIKRCRTNLCRFYVSTSKSIIKALINMHSFEIQLSPIG